jgi:hypothetical protein
MIMRGVVGNEGYIYRRVGCGCSYLNSNLPSLTDLRGAMI